MDGREIYAINSQQELCKIDVQSLDIVNKRRLKEELDPEKVKISHIRQVTPWIMAVGCLVKPEKEEMVQWEKPFLFLICGDFSDQNAKLTVEVFKMPSSTSFFRNQSLVFRSLYIKERY